MNLLRIGNRIVNLDRVTEIALASDDPEGGPFVRFYFHAMSYSVRGKEAATVLEYLEEHYVDITPLEAEKAPF